ncbi:MAG: hypothetical protein GY835_27450 [bacterium]|nr:hypothetical protein [bacterium]
MHTHFASKTTALPTAGMMLLLALLLSASASALVPLPLDDNDHNLANAYIFRPGELATIEVTMSPAALDSMLDNPWTDEMRLCSVRFVNSIIDETVQSVAIRVRGNTSRSARKKSFKLDFNHWVSGRKFHGLEKMNLNGEHNDVSIIRSRLAWSLLKEMRVPSSRAHHVLLKINDGAAVEGVQIHVEQIDEEMVQAWFDNKEGSLYKCLYQGDRADLRWIHPGTGATYAGLGGGETYAEKNLDHPTHDDLAGFIGFINHSTDAEFAAELGDRFSLDNFLRAMAVDVCIGNWDNYWFGANNYYLYHNTDSNRLEYIPYDLDNTYGVDFMGINWGERSLPGWGDGGYGSHDGQLPPLIRRILAVPSFVEQLRHYVRELVDGPFALTACEANIDMIHTLIGPWAFAGSYEGYMDWSYDTEMFHESYDLPDYYRNWDWGWDYGLKPYIADRTGYLRNTVPITPPQPRLVINEFMADNETWIADEYGEFDDWVEIFNYDDEPHNLAGMSLSDEIGNPRRYQFPDTLLQPGGYLVVWCDGEPTQGPLHADFKLSGTGEELGLFNTTLNAVAPLDTVTFGMQIPDRSYGRVEDGGPVWDTLRPTPGESNNTNAVPWIDDHNGSLSDLSAWPNPVASTTRIAFSLGETRHVTVRLITPGGREVIRLGEGDLPPGRHDFTWDGRDGDGHPLPAGVYLYRVTADTENRGGKLLLLR